jgi:hypothetical protein
MVIVIFESGTNIIAAQPDGFSQAVLRSLTAARPVHIAALDCSLFIIAPAQ